MIIYGWGDKTVKKYQDSYIKCNQCGGYSHTFYIFQKYFHIFWIPFFALGGKKIACQCDNCGDESNTDKMHHYLSITRTPVWLFSGLILVLFFTVFTLTRLRLEVLKSDGYMRDPQIGDVFQIMDEVNNKKSYHFYKVAGIEQDTLFLYQNAYYYTSKKAEELDDEDYFIDNDVYYLLKEELPEMKESGKLIKVFRKYPAKSNFNREFSIEFEEDEEEI